MTNTHLSNLTKTLTEIKDPREMRTFLKMLLTPKELNEIPKRLEIFNQLRKGLPQRKIAANLGVGIATITRGSLELQRNKNWWDNKKSRQSLA
jgi:TrpR family transcriptional regulator, trp operon repressor